MIKRNRIFVVVFAAVGIMYAKAQDFPQWRGLNRDGVVKTTGVNLNWTEKKPTLLWTFRQAGAGYASPTIAGNTLYCQGGAEGNDFAFALDAQTGKLKWKQILGEQFKEERGNGAHGAVTIDGDKLYLIRCGGQIHCLAAADGKLIWQKDFKKDYNGKIMSGWGYSESPLVDGNLVICTPGGKEGTIIALNKNTGDLVWRTTELTDDAGYSSPIVADVDGIRQYIQQSAKGVSGIAKDGKVLWKVEIDDYRTAVIPTPVYNDHTVYVTNGYNSHCTSIRLTKDGNGFKTEIVYENKDLANHHGGVVLVNGYVYGFAERPVASWVCQNFKSGETVWKQKIPEVSKGAVLCVDDRLLLLDEKTGLLTVAAASPDGWKEFGRMEMLERSKMESKDNMVWTHPVVANCKLYLRDHDLLFCFDIKK